MGIDLQHGYRDLRHHIGHELECSRYGDQAEPANVAIECITCGEVLLDFERDATHEEDAEDTTT